MADEPRRPRRRERIRQERERVIADLPRDQGPDDPDAGSAGVREPRLPKPLGPMSGAGQRPLPEPPLIASLPDPRQ
jgi:hypothetical protein